MRKLKANEAYKKIPVVILIDSNEARYRSECYQQGAASVIQKPTSAEATKSKIKTFFEYWLTVAEL